jgi:uncharacterized membrane protein YidH (DUF202 family)
MRAFGIVLIVIGLLALALPYISFTRQEKVLDIGPIEAVKEKRETIPIPGIVGLAAVVAGTAIVVVSIARNKS